MSLIQPDNIVSARRRVEALNLSEAESLCETIYETQPILLASIVILPRLGVRHTDLDIALRILLICYESAREVAEIPPITEIDLERCMNRITGRAIFLEGLDPTSSAQAVKDQVENHPEPYLLAIAFSILQENDLWAVRSESEKHLQLAVFNVVETISEAINNRQPA